MGLAIDIGTLFVGGGGAAKLGVKGLRWAGAFRATRVVAKTAGKAIFYPALAPYMVATKVGETAVKFGLRGLYRVPFELLKSEAIPAAGYFLMAETGNHPIAILDLHAAGILIDDYHRIARAAQVNDEASGKQQGITVYIDGVPDDNTLYGYGEYDFQQRYGRDPNAHYIHVDDILGIRHALTDLAARHGPIANVEIVGHGLPGQMSIGQATLDGDAVHNLEGVGDIFAADATIKLISCLVGHNFRFSPTGERFMRDLGQALLHDGGRVVASAKVVYVPSDSFPPEARRNESSAWDTYSKQMLLPLESAILLGIVALGKNKTPVRQVEILPRDASTALKEK